MRGITTFDGKVVRIPSVKVNDNIFTDVILEKVGSNFNLVSYGSVSKSSEPAASLFNGQTLTLHNVDFNDKAFSNVVLKHEGNYSFSLIDFDIPLEIHETSYANRKTEIHTVYPDKTDGGRAGFNTLAVGYTDIDNDGDDDMIVGNIWFPESGSWEEFFSDAITEDDVVPVTIDVYKNEEGNLVKNTSVIKDMPVIVHARKILTVNLNNDAYPDIVIADHGFDKDPYPGGFVHMLMSNIDGTYNTVTIPIQEYHHSISAGDLDNDGDVDLLTSSGILMLNDGNGTFDTSHQNWFKNWSHGIFTVEITDLNNDGYNEIVTSGHTWWTPSRIYVGSEDAKYEKIIEITNNTPFGVVVDLGFEDLNNDGDLEIILTASQGPDNFYRGAQIMAVELDEYLNPINNHILYTNEKEMWIPWLRYGDYNNDGYVDIMHDNAMYPLTLFNQSDFMF